MRVLRIVSIIVGVFFCAEMIFAQTPSREYKVGGEICQAMANDNAEGGTGLTAFLDLALSNPLIWRVSIGGYSSDTKVEIRGGCGKSDSSLRWI